MIYSKTGIGVRTVCKVKIKMRMFREEDAAEAARIIAETLKTSNSRDYSKECIEANILSHSAEVLIERAKQGHTYLACDGLRIVGCGTIAEYYGSPSESILLTIFVLPEYQGKGIGRQIVETLERDEYFLRAKRIEIPASITGVGFYRKLGYGYKNGVAELDGEVYRLEKFR